MSMARLSEELKEKRSFPLNQSSTTVTYQWGLDIIRILYLFIWTFASGLLFFIPSVLLDNQEWWVIYVYNVAYLKYIRLSGAQMSR